MGLPCPLIIFMIALLIESGSVYQKFVMVCMLQVCVRNQMMLLDLVSFYRKCRNRIYKLSILYSLLTNLVSNSMKRSAEALWF